MCIPRFFLYGEPLRDADQQFVHVEPISKRCREADWHIAPHAHPDLHQLLLITRGSGTLKAEAMTVAFAQPALVRVPRGWVHGYDFEPDSEGWVATLSADLLDLVTTDYPELLPLFTEAAVVNLPDDLSTMTRFDRSFESLAAEISSDAPTRRPALASALLTLLVDALRLMSDDEVTRSTGCSRDSVLVARFKALLETGFRSDIGIGTYAERLCVSQERLRRACIRVIGSPPVALVAARRLLEAKRGLLYTSLTLARIASDCGFEDPAYFSRFFAQHTGDSPSMFRARRHAAQPVSRSRIVA
jgi:AraC family transcriptional regulator, transcriptional activator of pobA